MQRLTLLFAEAPPPERGRSLARSGPARQRMPGFSNANFAIHALRPGTGRAPGKAPRYFPQPQLLSCSTRVPEEML